MASAAGPWCVRFEFGVVGDVCLDLGTRSAEEMIRRTITAERPATGRSRMPVVDGPIVARRSAVIRKPDLGQVLGGRRGVANIEHCVFERCIDRSPVQRIGP